MYFYQTFIGIVSTKEKDGPKAIFESDSNVQGFRRG